MKLEKLVISESLRKNVAAVEIINTWNKFVDKKWSVPCCICEKSVGKHKGVFFIKYNKRICISCYTVILLDLMSDCDLKGNNRRVVK